MLIELFSRRHAPFSSLPRPAPVRVCCDSLVSDLSPVPVATLARLKRKALVIPMAPRLSREHLQHAVAHLRSFLRFLVGRSDIPDGCDITIDTPRVYRGERLPRSLPWGTVQYFLAAIDRVTAMGGRHYQL